MNVLEDDELRMRMGQAGQIRIREKFSTNAALSAILPAVCEVLQQKNICDIQYRGEIGYGTK